MSQSVALVELSNLEPNPANHAIQATQPTLPTATTQREIRRSQAIVIILQLTAITFLTSTSNGLMTVSIPRIASDLGIQPQLYYWYADSTQGTQGSDPSCFCSDVVIADSNTRPLSVYG